MRFEESKLTDRASARLWRPNARTRIDTTNSAESSERRRRPAGKSGDPTEAVSILAAWQRVSYRGYTIAERRGARAEVVRTLLAKLRDERLAISGLILVADDVALDQWLRIVTLDGDAPGEWSVQTANALLASHGRVPSDRVVVADELEAYLTDDLAAAVTGVRAILGLCASPRGLGPASHLRKHIGRAIDATQFDANFDVHAFVAEPGPVAAEAEQEDPDEVREQLLAVNDPQDLFSHYLREIQKFPLLNADEEIELAKLIEAGLYATELIAAADRKSQRLTAAQRHCMTRICREGMLAKERFLTANLRLVVSLARRYSARIELMDAIQEGNLGLIRAVEKFDYTKGYKFSTYATWWIRQAVTRAIPDQTYLIRVPVHQFESDYPIIAEWRRQSREAGSPSAAEVASALNLSTDEVEKALRRHQRPYSFEEMIEQGFDIEDPHAHTFIHHDAVYGLLRDQVQAVLKTLSEREAGVIRLRFGFTDDTPRTLDEIGQVYGVTRERIRQIEAKVMLKLRHPSRSQVLRDYFDGVFDPELVTDDSQL